MHNTTYKENRLIIQVVLFYKKIAADNSLFATIWCERRDLNPYGITTRPSNVRVCRFRHSRKSIFKGRLVL